MVRLVIVRSSARDEILRHFEAEIEMEFRAPDLNKLTTGLSIMIIAELVLKCL